jgi:GcrA cell cycle regulator
VAGCQTALPDALHGKAGIGQPQIRFCFPQLIGMRFLKLGKIGKIDSISTPDSCHGFGRSIVSKLLTSGSAADLQNTKNLLRRNRASGASCTAGVLLVSTRCGEDNFRMSWTDERVEQLKKLWIDGLSASQIAQELGGVTRNAVIGKVHRLGLSGRAKSASHSSIARQKRPARTGFNQKPARISARQLSNTGAKLTSSADAASLAMLEEAATAPTALKLALTQLTERTCKWPIGDPQMEEFHFCGNESREGTPYCAYHNRIAYQPVADRRRDKKIENMY